MGNKAKLEIDYDTMKIKSWSQAQRDFDTYYFTWKPCKHGHISKNAKRLAGHVTSAIYWGRRWIEMTKEQREQWQQDLMGLGENAYKMWQYLCMEDQINGEYWADCISNKHFPLSKGTRDVRRKDLTIVNRCVK